MRSADVNGCRRAREALPPAFVTNRRGRVTAAACPGVWRRARSELRPDKAIREDCMAKWKTPRCARQPGRFLWGQVGPSFAPYAPLGNTQGSITMGAVNSLLMACFTQ